MTKFTTNKKKKKRKKMNWKIMMSKARKNKKNTNLFIYSVNIYNTVLCQLLDWALEI